MNVISERIREAFADYAICKDKSADSLFAGRNLPTFVKDYILNRFSNGDIRDENGIENILQQRCWKSPVRLTPEAQCR